MLSLVKNNRAVYILYAERNFASGITVTARIYDNTNVQISGSPFTLSELDSVGLYGVSFTPSVNGEYKILVYEGTTKMSSASIKVTDYDIESIGGDVTSILSLLENATYGLSALNTDIDAIYNYLTVTIATAISNVKSDTANILSDTRNVTYGLSAIKTLIDVNQSTLVSNISTVSGNVDTILSEVQNATYGLSSLKTLMSTAISALTDIKGANFNTSTDSLRAISIKLNSITTRTGGYIS